MAKNVDDDRFEKEVREWTISVRVTKEAEAALEILTEKTNYSANWLVWRLIQEYLDEQKESGRYPTPSQLATKIKEIEKEKEEKKRASKKRKSA